MLPGYGAGRLAGLTARETRGALPHLLGRAGAMRMLFETLTRGDERRETMRRAREYGAAGY